MDMVPTINTNKFYNNTETKYRDYYKIKQKRQKKHHKRYISDVKIHTVGGINAGVSHGIKRPRPRPSLDNSKENNNTQDVKSKQEEKEITSISSIGRSSSPEVDLTKRFFKFRCVSKRNSSALVTPNRNTNLKVASYDKVGLNESGVNQIRSPSKLNISVDANDLTVDEPDLEATIEKNKVANILKILEDDWADDEWDTEKLLNQGKCVTPLQPVTILNNDNTLQTNELSDIGSMTNTNVNMLTAIENISCNSNKEDRSKIVSEPKYYPLFYKEYSANNEFNESKKKINHTEKENVNWQLSVKLNGSENQYQLDAGQKNFGATQCTECGVVYQIGDPEDENAHLNYHNNKKTLKFPGWKTERILMEDQFTSSRIILVEPGDLKLYWKKVADILAYVDRDLGLVDTEVTSYDQKKVFLYIRDKAVIGVLVAEHITSAHCMIPDLLELDCCSAESIPAKCGINVVWTDLNHRRQGIATKLVNILRAHFYFGYMMSVDDIAFSIPTVSGKIFAEKYTKTRNFKVYN